jgi:peptidyl-prolyl cis-trans isomerase SurA
LAQKKKDTIAVIARITSIKERLKAGESFEKLASELSEDPSAKANKGNLGWISAFRYPYGFENGAYSLKKGQISEPVITKFGMHIIRLNDKRPSPGEVKVAHIMLAVPQNAPDSVWAAAKLRADKLYLQLKNGEDFAKLAKENSDDQNSGKQGGELAWFGSGRMIPEFENAAFALKTNGDISQPVRTVVGWHILKLLDKHPVGTFDQAKSDLKTKVAADEQRSKIVSNLFLQKLKKVYPNKIYNEALTAFYQLDSSIYKGTLTLNEVALSKPMLVINKQVFTGAKFKTYLENNPVKNKKTAIVTYINESFQKFIETSFLAYEDEMLEKKYPDFSNLITEYHDGILLFDIMDQQVWSKASADTIGLQAYYKNVWVAGKKDPQKLEDARGLITADYQSYLEEKWIEELKNKYKVAIKQDLFDKIAAKYKTTQ